MEPVSTPYDIAAITPSPFSPSPLAWGLLFGGAALVLLIFYLALGKRRSANVTARAALLKQLKTFQSNLHDGNVKQTAHQAARAIRRYQYIIDRTSSLTDTYSGADEFRILDSLRFAPSLELSQVSPLLAALEKKLELEAK